MQYNSFGEYLKSLPADTVFRLWEYKRLFTPYEQARLYEDQSVLENDECFYVCIKDIINLPDGDILLATYSVESGGIDDYITYYKLSNIALAKCEADMEEEDAPNNND